MRRCLTASVVLSALAMLIALSPVYAVFRPAMTYDLSGSASVLCLSDLNGDGKLDMTIGVSEVGASGIATLINNGDGIFSDGIRLNGDFESDFLLSRDLNGDGRSDIVAAISGNQIVVFMSEGYPAFSPAASYTVGNSPEWIASADLNGDSSPDLLVACRNSDIVSVLLNDGAGLFSTRVDYSVEAPVSVATADLDNDNDADVVVSGGDNTAHAFLNDGSGILSLSWTHKTLELSYPVIRLPLATSDLNRDGFVDFVVGHEYADSLSVCLGIGDGTFQQPVIYAAPLHTLSVATADFDLDTYPDVITADYSVSLFNNAGDGSLEPYQSFPYNALCSSLATGDLDNDGDIDYATVGGTSQVFVVHNQTIVVYLCGDANSDGQVDISDVVFLVQYIFSGGSAPASILLADVDLSGAIDISDAVYMISHIFSGGFAPCAGK